MQNLPVQDWRGTQRESLGEILCVSKVKLQHLPFQVGHGSGEGWREGGIHGWSRWCRLLPPCCRPSSSSQGVFYPHGKGKRFPTAFPKAVSRCREAAWFFPKGLPAQGSSSAVPSAPAPGCCQKDKAKGSPALSPGCSQGSNPLPVCFPRSSTTGSWCSTPPRW